MEVVNLTENQTEITKSCSNCGAVIAISPEDLVITCKFCGETFDVDGKKIPNHQLIPTKENNEITQNVENFLKKNKTDLDQATIQEVQLKYLPYWVVPFNSKTHYYGVLASSVTRYRTETRTVRTPDGKTRTETVQVPYQVSVYRPEEADFNRNGRENVIARKHTAFYGFNEFQSTLFLDNIIPFDFNKIKRLDAEFINAEVNSHEAQIETYGRVENTNRSIAQSRVQRLIRCDSVVNIDEPLYVHAPLWVVRYKFQDKIYKVSAAGDSGKIVKGEIPLTKKRRLINFILGVGLFFIFAILGNTGFNAFFVNSDDWGLFLTAISIVVMLVSFKPIKTSFQIQLEKSEIKDIHKDRKQSLKQKAKEAKMALAQGNPPLNSNSSDTINQDINGGV